MNEDSPAPRMGDIELLSKADLRQRVKELLESEGKLIEICERKERQLRLADAFADLFATISDDTATTHERDRAYERVHLAASLYKESRND